MTDISVIGPLARSATDLSLALDVIAGPDPSWTARQRRRCRRRARCAIADLRVAVWSSEPGQDTDTEITATDRRAGRLPGTRGRAGQPHRTAGHST